ncbi:DUF1090 domain-containing protein [Comamonas sp. 17RB]|uniref:DUF1090 domain-containing protein n=1 Tax=Comamonas sp. 17RB TaxID=3047025 RepID=UPI0024B6A07B|nr:DUF1090 domain-containing protein [Comamonas sp. 17RB]MDI9855555.1 DUF1090 domain-containing protein [Comamonas sp. 17RB]
MTAIAMSALACHAVLAQPAPPVHAMCESKRAEIARDIEHAKGKGKSNRVWGLKKALRENQDHCSDAKLTQEHAAKIAAQERKVQERQRELDEAQEKGKPSKIADREAKLAKERAELEKLRQDAMGRCMQ